MILATVVVPNAALALLLRNFRLICLSTKLIRLQMNERDASCFRWLTNFHPYRSTSANDSLRSLRHIHCLGSRIVCLGDQVRKGDAR